MRAGRPGGLHHRLRRHLPPPTPEKTPYSLIFVHRPQSSHDHRISSNQFLLVNELAPSSGQQVSPRHPASNVSKIVGGAMSVSDSERNRRKTSTGEKDGFGSDAIGRRTVLEERKSVVEKTETVTTNRVGEKAVGGFVGFIGEDDPQAFDFQNAHSGEEDLQWVESLEKRTCGPSISKMRARMKKIFKIPFEFSLRLYGGHRHADNILICMYGGHARRRFHRTAMNNPGGSNG
ncbi:hypothetical protein ACLOJK_041955 [Asimina triloba]